MQLPSPMTAKEIAEIAEGQIRGNADVSVTSIALDPLKATKEDMALVTDRQILKFIDKCQASIMVVPHDLDYSSEGQTVILVKRPKIAIQKLCQKLAPPRFYPEKGIHPTAIIDKTANVSKSACIGPYVVIGPHSKVGDNTIIMSHTSIGGKVEIGEDCLIYPSCLIADYTQIHNRVILQQGAGIGSDGFGYTTARPTNAEIIYVGGHSSHLSEERNPHIKVPQIGKVIIEDDVEVGSYATIDRATIGNTIIGAGTKIDNLALIAHNCKVGKDCIVIGTSAIGGSCTIGDRSILAGGVKIKDHVVIGKDVVLEGLAGVMRDVEDCEIQVGIPATNAREQIKMHANMRRIPRINDDVRELKEKVRELEAIIEKLNLAESKK